jgi:hypothetical protein
MVTPVSSSAKKRSTYIRATLKPASMPQSKLITPAKAAELERRQADWERKREPKAK